MSTMQVALTIAVVFSSTQVFAAEPIVFEDVTARAGLAKVLETVPGQRPWRYAHGAGWGDVNGDGRPDLYIGAFAGRKWYEGAESPTPNFLFINGPDGFSVDGDKTLQFKEGNARCSGVLFADLDNDGDQDLMVCNHASGPKHQGSKLFENTGGGKFREATPGDDVWPGRIGMRNASVLDFNGDGLLDLILADGSYGKLADQKARLIVLKNLGGLKFADASAEFGFPQDKTLGLGLAIGDVNQDGRPDVFVCGSNRLFVSDAKGQYQEDHAGRFSAKPADVREGMHCGASFADLNGDDLLDLVTTEHGVPCRIHVYQNKGVRDGVPDLVEVGEAIGLGSLFPMGTKENPIKTTHVALQDMDNDGRPDMFLAVTYRDEQGRVQPVVLKNLAKRGGDLKFSEPPWDKMNGYYAPAPLADYDRDGRLDVFLASWFENLPNYLMKNVTAGGNWLDVRVAGQGAGRNTMGIGAVVRLYKTGQAGKPDQQLGRYDIVVGTGYASTEEPIAHFGLGEAKDCDLEVTWNGQTMRQTKVAANQALTVTVSKSK